MQTPYTAYSTTTGYLIMTRDVKNSIVDYNICNSDWKELIKGTLISNEPNIILANKIMDKYKLSIKDEIDFVNAVESFADANNVANNVTLQNIPQKVNNLTATELLQFGQFN